MCQNGSLISRKSREILFRDRDREKASGSRDPGIGKSRLQPLLWRILQNFEEILQDFQAILQDFKASLQDFEDFLHFLKRISQPFF